MKQVGVGSRMITVINERGSYSKLNRQPNTADEDLASFFTLFDHFLLKHFMMYVFYEGEEVCSSLLNRASDKTFVHNGQRGYRNSTY